MKEYKGIAFPFKFGGNGGIATTQTSETDFTHLKEEIIQLVCTRLGERVFNPEYGCKLQELIFRNMDDTTLTLMKDYVRDAIETSIGDIVDILDIDIESTDIEGSECVIISIDLIVKKFLKQENISFKYSSTKGVM